MSEEITETIRVNFAKHIPVFPLEQTVLLPHAVAQLFIFEPRYRQMMQHVLDSHGLIAMATFDGDQWQQSYSDAPPVKPVVCIGHVARHEQNPDGTYRLWLAGVCRASIHEELLPEGDRLYRAAMLRPLGTGEDPSEPELEDLRAELISHLEHNFIGSLGPLREELARRPDIPTLAMLELISMALISSVDDASFAYTLLAEPSVFERAAILRREFRSLDRIMGYAKRQYDPAAPPGITWN